MKDTLKRASAVATALLPDALIAGGAAAVSYGAHLIYAPAGYIVGGLLSLVVGRLIAIKGGE